MTKQLEVIKALREMGATAMELRGSQVTSVEFPEKSSGVVGFATDSPEGIENFVNEAIGREIEGLKDELEESKDRAGRKQATKKEHLTYNHSV